MKKRIITAAFLAFIFGNKANAQETKTDSSAYKKTKLKIEEVNFISSYYTQDGNNSAVTGGVGTEKLTDVATTLDIKVSRRDKKNRKQLYGFELGVDSYTSASSDKIDPNTVTSASYQDVRVYPSLNFSSENEEKRQIFSSGVSASAEYDYFSLGANLGYTKYSKNKNTEFNVKGMAFFDTWKVILPIELRNNPDPNYKQGDMKPRTSYNLGFTLSQVMNRNFQMAFLLDLGYQEGLLATKFNRVYFNDSPLNSALATVKSENLPDTRFKIPIGMRANYFLGDHLILRAFYRYYWDNWNINSHTISLEPTIKLSAFSSLSIPYRYYVQTKADYFQPIFQHNLADEYFTSDYDLSAFSSNMIGLGYKIVDHNKGLFNVKRINSLELRYGYYNRNNGLSSHIVTLAMKFK
ncbi:Protein of unknown function [Flavobacterium indicum GPTSA100-9 = DSM 17447]|uniref:DUF3570 domain-containing protein n=1 Tax=Flavobacterium indicum (strain DSM 17447 / CIP 109464 / GPTSA100-9) TaxID=1094466 RepID=H8XU68_FLAIG|nr:DUF3570 domain-containing protein [Flavobacterium indicum]CCG52851.1 Protein of unknown function [Flavobacterium indicum GPTSA100-9 = DSM 17447]